MIKVFQNIDHARIIWKKFNKSFFLDIDFLQIYYDTHRQLKHLFILDSNMRIYAHIFPLSFNRMQSYIKNNFLARFFLMFLHFDILYLTNSFITNTPSFSSTSLINLDRLIHAIKDNYSIIVIPDFLFKKMKTQDIDYVKVEVEEEMILDIRGEWHVLDDYVFSLRKKYRNKIKKILKDTSSVDVRVLDSTDLEYYDLELRRLFLQVVQSSNFNGPEFNTSSLSLFVNKGFMKVSGYFINEKLVAFSSEIEEGEALYSYFVGFDRQVNSSLPIYGRILIENIRSAINSKKDYLVLGRTANEYKSNFGATPIKSFIYLKVKNRFLRFFLAPIYGRLSIRKWQQRQPFKRQKASFQ